MSSPEFSGQIPYFLQTFLSRPASALPKGSQWVLQFEGSYISGKDTLQAGNEVVPVTAIKKGLEYEPRKWDVEKALETVLTKEYQQSKGCLFAQAVEIPGESTTINPEGLQQNGFIRTTTGGGRDAYNGIKVVFLDTNVSFVDNVIRPWVIATSHLGLIARSGESNYRGNMTVYKLGVLTPDVAPYVLQKYTFYGICPVSVSGEEYNYAQTSSHVNRETTFIFHYYTVESSSNNLAIDNNSQQIPVQLSTKEYGVNVAV